MKAAFNCLLSDLYDKSAILTLKNILPGLAVLSEPEQSTSGVAFTILFHSKMSREHLHSSFWQSI